MNKGPTDFLVTTEHRRFAEFCDACRRYRYIGLCYGAAGVGKTLSAQHYAHWFGLQAYFHSPWPSAVEVAAAAGSTTVFYTPAVVNTPRGIAQDIQITRYRLRALAIDVDRFAVHLPRHQNISALLGSQLWGCLGEGVPGEQSGQNGRGIRDGNHTGLLHYLNTPKIRPKNPFFFSLGLSG